ncbi:hypothetical protein Hanom_Chr08g00698031 [Helianthus anomalus]
MNFTFGEREEVCHELILLSMVLRLEIRLRLCIRGRNRLRNKKINVSSIADKNDGFTVMTIIPFSEPTTL